MTDVNIDAEARRTLAGDATVEDDPEVEELTADIVETREEMTVTVEEIGDRLDPHNIVEGAKESVRQATVGKVENMANTAEALVTDAGETVREAGTSVVDTITRNPIPAALVGVGVAWLALSRRPARGYDPNARWRPDDADAMRTSGYGDTSPIDSVQRRAGRVADSVGRTVDDVTGQVRRVANDVPDDLRSTADQIAGEASRLFDSNPLAVGAIAVAVGTAVSLAMPATQAERRALARPARQLVARAQDAATDALDTAEQTARDAEQQARTEDAKAKAH